MDYVEVLQPNVVAKQKARWFIRLACRSRDAKAVSRCTSPGTGTDFPDRVS